MLLENQKLELEFSEKDQKLTSSLDTISSLQSENVIPIGLLTNQETLKQRLSVVEQLLAQKNDPALSFSTHYSELESKYKDTLEVANLVKPLKIKLQEVGISSI